MKNITKIVLLGFGIFLLFLFCSSSVSATMTIAYNGAEFSYDITVIGDYSDGNSINDTIEELYNQGFAQVRKDNFGRQYHINDSRLVIGDGSTKTDVLIENADLWFDVENDYIGGGFFLNNYMHVTANSNFTLRNSSLVFNGTSGLFFLDDVFYHEGVNVTLDNCRILAPGVTGASSQMSCPTNNKVSIWHVKDCIINHLGFAYGNISIENTLLNGIDRTVAYGLGQCCIRYMDECVIKGYDQSFYFPPWVGSISNTVLTDCRLGTVLFGRKFYAEGLTIEDNDINIGLIGLTPTGNDTLRNCIIDDYNSGSGGIGADTYLNIEFGFDCCIVNSSGVIDGAWVNVTNKTGGFVCSVQTGSNGWIDTQYLVTRSINNFISDFWYFHVPFTYNISYNGATIEFSSNMTGELNWTLFLPDLCIPSESQGDWNYSQPLCWQILNLTDYTILKLSESGNFAVAGEIWENTNSPPPGSNIVFAMNNSFWLDENGDLYLEGEAYEESSMIHPVLFDVLATLGTLVCIGYYGYKRRKRK